MSVLSKITSGVVGLLVLGAGGWAAAAIPTPLGTSIAPLTETVTPAGVTRHLVCAGAIVGHNSGSADIVPVGRVSLATSGGDRNSVMSLAGRDNGVVIAQGSGKSTPAATESGTAHDSQLVGYLATECGDALNEQWLAAGSTETGRESTLMLSNGADVDARVDIDIWGTNGRIDAPGSKGIVVPAHTQRAYSVAGFAPNEPSPALHVVSTGAAIWATLQVSTVRGLVPGGLDRIGSASEPSTTLAFPDVRIPTDASIGEVLADPAYSDVPPAIRFLNPGDSDATATITLIPADGGDPQSVTATVPAGVVTEIGLSDFAAGDWSILVTSDQPLVGGVRTGFHSADSGVTDVAWENASPVHAGTMAIESPASATLGLLNPGTSSATVTVTNGDLVTKVTVPAGGAVVRPVSPGVVVLKSDVAVAASLSITTAGGIATVRALPAPNEAGAVVVVYG